MASCRTQLRLLALFLVGLTAHALGIACTRALVEFHSFRCVHSLDFMSSLASAFCAAVFAFCRSSDGGRGFAQGEFAWLCFWSLTGRVLAVSALSFSTESAILVTRLLSVAGVARADFDTVTACARQGTWHDLEQALALQEEHLKLVQRRHANVAEKGARLVDQEEKVDAQIANLGRLLASAQTETRAIK